MFAKLAFFLSLLASLASAQMAQQAQMAAQRPAKIDVVPLASQNVAGQPVPVQIRLLDASGKPIAAREPVDAELVVKQPSGQTTVTKVTLSPGESTKQVDVNIPEAGVTELKVRQSSDQLIGSTNYTLATSTEKHSAHKRARSTASEKKKTAGSTKPISHSFGLPPLHSARPKLVFAAYMFQDPDPAPAPAPDLMLKVSGEDVGGGVRADAKTCARVQVFYTGADDLARDVQVWLQWSNGDIDPNPVIISKQTRTGAACWTSGAPIAAATIEIAAANPHISFSAGDRQTMKFSENIQGVGFVNPPYSITIVDNYNLTAAFYDPLGRPVKLIGDRDLLFDSNNGIIHVTPQHATVPGGKFDSSTILVPTYFGKSTIQVSAESYAPETREIRVTWLTALLGSLLGGLLGGWLAFINSGGILWKRIVTGLIVGFFSSWAYVLVGLPKVESSIAHNQIAVIFVALAAGFVGVKAISVITGKLNFGF